MPLIIERLTPATAGQYAAFLLALEGEAAAADFQKASDLLAQESFFLLLAALDGQPAGAATAAVIPKLDARRGFLFVDELAVLPAFRRRGVARALLAHLESLARELGLAGVRLLARPENAAARALYRALGYAESESAFFEKRPQCQ
jgi:ribosomal protein S18 acetylase RimI-like enzyme